MNTNQNHMPVVTGLLLGILITAMDNTIVAAAIGKIIAGLGGMDKMAWVTSAYMLASIPSMLIFGRLSDMYGRKRFYLLGASLFIIGSLLCGVAQSMSQLILYRAIQGFGSGAIGPIAFTIIFDSFPPERRGKMAAMLGGVFALSGIIAPLIGAFFADYFNWRWIFFINLPLGLVSILLVTKYYVESFQYSEQKVDWLGAGVLIIMLLSLLFTLELGGKRFAWDSMFVMGLMSIFLVMFIAFNVIERRTPDPIVPLNLFRNQLFLIAQIVCFLYGFVGIVLIVYIPLYIMGMSGGSATDAATILMPMVISSVIGAQIGGYTMVKYPYRSIMLCSVVIVFTGTLFLSLVSTTTSYWLIGLNAVITSIGIGICSPVMNLAAIHNLSIYQRGSANSLYAFFRTLGMSMGVTLFGSMQNNVFSERIQQLLPLDQVKLSQLIDVSTLLQPEIRASIPPEPLILMLQAFNESIIHIFWWELPVVMIAGGLICMMDSAKAADDQSVAEMAISE